jgi:septal ring factor EnvC (AmiA/AmiB activator)
MNEHAGIVETGPVAEKLDISQPTSHEINEACMRVAAELSRAREELTRHQRRFPSLLADVATGLAEEGAIEEVRQRIAHCQRAIAEIPLALGVLEKRLDEARQRENYAEISRVRDEQALEYEELKARIIKQGSCTVAEQERLVSLGGFLKVQREAEALLVQLKDWQRRKLFDRDGSVGEFVFVQRY